MENKIVIADSVSRTYNSQIYKKLKQVFRYLISLNKTKTIYVNIINRVNLIINIAKDKERWHRCQ